MKVSFLTPSISRALGGIYEIERNLAQALVASTPTQLEVIGLEDEYTEDDLPEWAPLEPTVLPVMGPILFGYSPSLSDTLDSLDSDLLHLHVLWRYTSVASLRWHRQTNRPHIVTINGMLDRWAVQNSRWKKRVAGWLYEHANLQEAACLQVNTEKEYRAVREYGIDTPACIIPNGVTLPPDTTPPLPPWSDSIGDDQRVLLFLGRIHPKKGIFELVDAWQQLRDTAPAVTDAWSVAIVGWDDGGHVERLKKNIEDAGLTEDLVFLGPMFGEEKHAAFSHANAFVLPSYSEGLPMAVLEAWSYRLPVLLTPGCNLDIGLDWNAAVETRPDPDRLCSDLHAFLSQSAEDRHKIGQNGRRLVEDRFTWTQVAQQLHRVYQWMLGNASLPETIRVE